MSNAPTTEPSGTHSLPRDEGGETFRLPRGALVVIVAALIGGGGGSGITTLLHGEPKADPQMLVSLAEIKSKLDLVNAKLDTSARTLDDHEARIRALEKKGGH